MLLFLKVNNNILTFILFYGRFIPTILRKNIYFINIEFIYLLKIRKIKAGISNKKLNKIYQKVKIYII